jgi:hypothetical protein
MRPGCSSWVAYRARKSAALFVTKTNLQSMACDVPILLAGHVEVSDVVRFAAVVGRSGD